ncbi:homing endonuclease [Escherichia phage Bp7]|uniref:Homing endonuclease n=1 Tax=Escherichia phage Bp7 TaxID=1052121 RepID=G3MUF5_9CAUD|nr:homing endonuclease [Escherichia phage Bp7]AEN93825.1 homing endonuclease [Escherichia phage Bp7]
MNYNKIYDDLVNRALERGLIKENLKYYTESHHIIPECIGGPDIDSNKVLFTAREHFIAHILLYKIYKLPKLIYAVHMMCNSSEKHQRNSKMYDWLRKDHKAALSKKMTDAWKAPEFRTKMVAALYQRHKDKPVTEETREKQSNSLKRYYKENPISEEAKKKNSEAQKQRFKDRPQTEETKRLRKDSCRKTQGTPIWLCNSNGVGIEKFSSAAEAKEILGLSGHTQNIYTACKRNKETGRLYKSSGLIWKYQ